MSAKPEWPQPRHIVLYPFLFNPEWGYIPRYKVRPCVVYQSGVTDNVGYRVFLMPISHMPPPEGMERHYVYLDAKTRKAVGLDENDQWICCCQVNILTWMLATEDGQKPSGKVTPRKMPSDIMCDVAAIFNPLYQAKPRRVWMKDMTNG